MSTKPEYVFPQDTKRPDKVNVNGIEFIEDVVRREGGLTKRELFAALLLPHAIMAEPGGTGVALAVKLADALVVALDANKEA